MSQDLGCIEKILRTVEGTFEPTGTASRLADLLEQNFAVAEAFLCRLNDFGRDEVQMIDEIVRSSGVLSRENTESDALQLIHALIYSRFTEEYLYTIMGLDGAKEAVAEVLKRRGYDNSQMSRLAREYNATVG